jgi:segregation and condensation protein B
LDSRLPGGFSVPTPSDDPALRDDEDPLEASDLELALVPTLEPDNDGSDSGDAGANGPSSGGENAEDDELP